MADGTKSTGADPALTAAAGYALPELWATHEDGREWARGVGTRDDGEVYGLKAIVRRPGEIYRWQTLNPQMFGSAPTLQAAVEAVEDYISHTTESRNPETTKGDL